MTAGLLWALARRFDVGKAVDMARHVEPSLLAAAFAALVLAVLVNAVRWQVILAAEGAAVGRGALTRLLFVGLFFNQVLPTGVGGDAVRAWRIRRLGIPLGAAARSVLLDRASGYVVMVAVYAASLPSLLRVLPQTGERAGVVAIFGIALSGLLALPLVGFLPARLMRLPGLSALAELSHAARRLIAAPAQCAVVLGLSVLTVGLAVAAFALMGDSLGIRLSFLTWLMVVPPVSLIQLAPVSLAGWGVRETATVVVLAGFGVAAAAALAVSVLMGLALIVLGLPGGLIWLADWDVGPSPAQAAAAVPAISGRMRRE